MPRPNDDRAPSERFTALFERTHRALLAYAVRRVATPADAADVVAETFVVALRRIDDVPAAPEDTPWLYGVARRILANHYRGERRRDALADRLRGSLIALGAPVHPEPRAGADVGPLLAALATLRPDDQEILRLVAWEELGHEQIAVVLGLSRGSVRVRLHRARTRLAAALAAQGDVEDAGVQRNTTSGHVVGGRVLARPGAKETP